jgi:hypothetical protein
MVMSVCLNLFHGRIHSMPLMYALQQLPWNKVVMIARPDPVT